MREVSNASSLLAVASSPSREKKKKNKTKENPQHSYPNLSLLSPYLPAKDLKQDGNIFTGRRGGGR